MGFIDGFGCIYLGVFLVGYRMGYVGARYSALFICRLSYLAVPACVSSNCRCLRLSAGVVSWLILTRHLRDTSNSGKARVHSEID